MNLNINIIDNMVMSGYSEENSANFFDFAVSLHHALQNSHNLQQSLDLTLLRLKNWLGISSIGVFFVSPTYSGYFSSVGHPPKYLFQQGFDSKENPPEKMCLCDLVLSNKTSPDLPYFTINGSFWTNELSYYDAYVKSQGGVFLSKPGCTNEQIESLAILPIRVNGQNTGLLILADERVGVFKLEGILFLELFCEMISNRYYLLGNLELNEDFDKDIYLKICMGCRKVSSDGLVWDLIENLLIMENKPQKYQFTHGYCPECLKKELMLINHK